MLIKLGNDIGCAFFYYSGEGYCKQKAHGKNHVPKYF